VWRIVSIKAGSFVSEEQEIPKTFSEPFFLGLWSKAEGESIFVEIFSRGGCSC